MKLDELTDADLLGALSLHPNAPSVRFYLDGGVRMVHAGKWGAADLRFNARNEYRDLRCVFRRT